MRQRVRRRRGLGAGLRGIVRGRTSGLSLPTSHHGTHEAPETHHRLYIVGSPNVGKSVLFNRLTGRYVVVSNYPGTTVEVSRGAMQLGDLRFDVVDTPGMYSMRPLSDEERVGRRLILSEPADVVVHVVDAKALDRSLAFTLQLIELGLPVVLAVNMMDEARRLGLVIDIAHLRAALGVPVVPMVALTGQGVDDLRRIIHDHVCT